MDKTKRLRFNVNITDSQFNNVVIMLSELHCIHTAAAIRLSVKL